MRTVRWERVDFDHGRVVFFLLLLDEGGLMALGKILSF